MSGSNLNLVIAGDSIGVGSVSGADPWKDLALGGTYTVDNHSFHGAYLGQMAGPNESKVLKDYDPNSGTNWLVVQAGTNDLSQGGTASGMYDGIEKLVQDGHALGFKVVIATVLPRNSAVFAWSDANENARLAYNDMVRANPAGADAIADVAASPIMGGAGAPANAALYLDGLHPTASAVQAYLEPIYAAIFSSSTSPAPAPPAPPPVATPEPVITPDPVSTPAPSAGEGSNQLVLHVSGDHYKGDPQFQVYVDGEAVGGTQTVTAVHGQNQWQDVTLKGDFSPSSAHAVEVRFLNDAYDGSGIFSEGHDRNLYVSSVTLDGDRFGTSEANPAVLLQNGSVTIATSGMETAPIVTPSPVTTPPPANTGTTPNNGNAGPTNPATLTIGSGPDQLVLNISQDTYLGDAQYVVLVDGQQIGGVQTAHAEHAKGQSELLTVQGQWDAGSHRVSVSFLNDFYGGSADADRNIYVNLATYNENDLGGETASLLQNGPHHFVFQANESLV